MKNIQKHTQLAGALAVIVAVAIAGWWLIAESPFGSEEGKDVVSDESLTPTEAADLLQGSTWVWTRTVMSDDTVVTPREAGEFTLAFDADGRVAGETDCNSFGGYYGLGDSRSISFGPFAMTKMFCEGSEEGKFTNQVSRSTRYIFDEDGNLILLLSYDSGSVFFEKQ